MKKSSPSVFITFCFSILFVLTVFHASAQNIRINQTFTQDTTFNPFNGLSQTYSMKVSGNVQLFSDSSLVRIVMIDRNGNRFLVFETYPLITLNNSFDFNEACDETCFLEGILPDSIRVDIINASVKLNTIYQDTNFISNATDLQARIKWRNDSVKISIMNQRISQEHMYWRSARTQFVPKLFNEKETIFGKKFNLLGYDYYKGGIFERVAARVKIKADSNIVQNFKWFDRHGSNDPTRPAYYNPNGLGWITDFRDYATDQTCYAFASIALAEATGNLFYNNNIGPYNISHPEINHQINFDLSEKQIMCKVGPGNCVNLI